jgi:DNA-binding transcriptional MocR family regulator
MRVTSWSATNLPAEIATLWIENGTAQGLLDLQRQEVRTRQALVSEILGSHVAQSHPLSLCAWLKVPSRWTEEGLVRMLAQKNIAVTPSDPFKAAPQGAGGIRICIGGRLSHTGLGRALQTIAETFEQLPPVFDTSSIA